jgi:hypothetical protein
MKSLAIAKDFNVLKYGLFSLVAGLLSLLMNELSFQGMKKAFRDRINPAVAFPAHVLADAVPG